jgi:hypothetical protein
VAVTIEGKRDAAFAHHLTQEQEVTLSVLLLSEDGVRDVAGRVINRSHKSEPWAVWTEPLMAAPVDLQQHPGLRHPLAARAVARRPPPLWTTPSGRSEDASNGGSAQRNRFPLDQQLRQVLIVATGVDTIRQSDHTGAQPGIERMHWWTPAIAVHEGGGPIPQERMSQASLVPMGQAHQLRRLTGGQPPLDHCCQDHCSSLFLPVHCDVLHEDRITEQLDRTKSQTTYTP